MQARHFAAGRRGLEAVVDGPERGGLITSGLATNVDGGAITPVTPSLVSVSVAGVEQVGRTRSLAAGPAPVSRGRPPRRTRAWTPPGRAQWTPGDPIAQLGPRDTPDAPTGASRVDGPERLVVCLRAAATTGQLRLQAGEAEVRGPSALANAARWANRARSRTFVMYEAYSSWRLLPGDRPRRRARRLPRSPARRNRRVARGGGSGGGGQDAVDHRRHAGPYRASARPARRLERLRLLEELELGVVVVVGSHNRRQP